MEPLGAWKRAAELTARLPPSIALLLTGSMPMVTAVSIRFFVRRQKIVDFFSTVLNRILLPQVWIRNRQRPPLTRGLLNPFESPTAGETLLNAPSQKTMKITAQSIQEAAAVWSEEAIFCFTVGVSTVFGELEGEEDNRGEQKFPT